MLFKIRFLPHFIFFLKPRQCHWHTFSFLQYLRLVQDSRFLFRNYKIAVQLNLAKAHELNLLDFSQFRQPLFDKMLLYRDLRVFY
jgi:hypothetical protein